MIGIGSKGSTLEIGRLTQWPLQSRVAWVLAGTVVLGTVGFSLAPWQQNAVATGTVIAYSPNERELSVQAPIAGRVVTWNFMEGALVERGDVLVELSDNDPLVLQRYRNEVDAIQQQAKAARASIAALQSRLGSLRKERELTLESMRAQIRMARSRLSAAELKQEAARAKQEAADLQLQRVTQLTGKGLNSQRDLELARRNAIQARAGTLEARANVEAASSEVASKKADRQGKASQLAAKIASAQDKLEVARSKLGKAEAELAKVERSQARQDSMQVRAPRSGMLVHVRAREGSAFVKPGQELAVIVPRTDQRAVELFVSGLDAPLVVPGQQVRLQFQGWPAIQFGGWPEAAVGTFGGEVAFVDARANAKGEFRVVVRPSDEAKWPSPDVLRQGNLVNGWVLLNVVPLGYELWRQLNGFPADLPDRAAKVSGMAPKRKPKL